MEKAFIIHEIKRTTAENGGGPLGSRRFSAEAGITEHHWHKYWARWSDALRDTGYQPNQRKQALEATKLLEMYAQLARELGRLPARSDVKVRSNADTGFPTMAPFDRLSNSSKTQLIRQLAEFCRSQGGYDDVLELCDQYGPPESLPDSDFITAGKEQIGYVYLIKMGRRYKLGKTNAVGRRERELAIQLPEKTKTIHAIRTDDPFGIEAYWHKRFEAKRMNGEWFDLDAADVSAFKRRKFM